MLGLILATVIYSTTNASASTGGNTVDSGGSVTTGSSSATTEVHTSFTGSSGTVTVESTTNANGEEKHEEKTVEITGDDPINVDVSVTAGTAGSEIKATVESTAQKPLVPATKYQEPEIINTVIATSTPTTADAKVATSTNFVSSVLNGVLSAVQSLVSALFSWW